MSNEIEQYQNPALAPVGEVDDFFDMPVEDFVKPRIPLLKLAQQQSEDKPAGVKNGEFYNTETGEVFEYVDAILMYAPAPRRGLFPPYERGKRKPLICSSSDGIRPTGGDAPLPGPCVRKVGGTVVAACPKAQWFGDTPPECSKIYTALLWIMGSESPALFTAMRTKAKPFEELTREMVKMKGAIADSKNPDIPPRFFSPVRITSCDVDGAYYNVKMELLHQKEHRLPVERARELADMARKFVADLTAMSTAEITQTEEA